MEKKENRGIGSSYVSELTKLRINAGLSLMEVEELTGIGYRVMSDWEIGKIKRKLLLVRFLKTNAKVMLLCWSFLFLLLSCSYDNLQ